MEFTPGPEIIFEYFEELSPAQKELFRAMGDLYAYWNQRINVISRKDMESFYQNHVLHSLGIAKVQQFGVGDKVLDVGTGGGFPGIPLAIIFPEALFHLVDSIGKKIKVVQAVIDELGLSNVSCEKIRVEEHTGSYNFVVCRAVTRLKILIKWIKPLVAPGGQLLCLKGGELEEEISEVRADVEICPLVDFFNESFFETKKVLKVMLKT